MAVLPLRLFSQDADSSLSAWIRARCESLSREYSVVFDFDFSLDSELVGISQMMLTKLGGILEMACMASRPKSTIEIGTFSTRRGTEVEVVTTTDIASDQSLNAFSKAATFVGNGFSLTTYRARCPQGGSAWILVQSPFAQLRMVA